MLENKHAEWAWVTLLSAWTVAMLSTLGSLFFSEFMEFIPCTLCWYQRIAMYPLIVILAIDIMMPNKSNLMYATPFVMLGWLMALYHNMIHYGIISESASPCVQGIPCSTKYIEWLGFITIPMLSFIAFSLIAILLFTAKTKG
ncbi:MAG: disulfide bond formation protein B [Sulfurovum sp.]|nr:disulfide bond formation protein B [Sulfurovum sp.]